MAFPHMAIACMVGVPPKKKRKGPMCFKSFWFALRAK